MRKFFVPLFAATVLCSLSLAQERSPGSAPATAPEQATSATAPEPQTSPSTTTAQPPQSQVPEQAPTAPEPQTTPQPSAQPAAASNSMSASAAHRVAPGSVIPVLLTKSIDAKRAKTGDEVVAKVTMDLKANNGDIVVPKDTKVVGHVTEAQARNKEQKDSQVGIMFDRAVMKGGDMQMPMSIQAIIAPQNPGVNNENSEQAAAPSGSGAAPGTGRTAGASSTPSPVPSTATGNNAPSDEQPGSNGRPQITGKTEGVVGFKDLKLDTSAAAQGSVVSSEKNNVKLESGTFMLLRVTQ